MPSTDENKKFFAEFNRLKNKDKKRKTEETDKEWTLPSEKKAKNDKNRKISSQGLIGEFIRKYTSKVWKLIFQDFLGQILFRKFFS